MIFRKAVLLAVSVLAAVTAQQYDDATANIQIGMQGLMEAGKDPALLAQLMQDLQVCRNISSETLSCLSDRSGDRSDFCSLSLVFAVVADRRHSSQTTASFSFQLIMLAVDCTSLVQNPELMAEAKKMMEDPDFKKKMEKLAGGKDFKESMKKTKELLDDPNKAAAAEAKFEHMQRVGTDRLKQGAVNDMEQAMAALANPEVMAEMTKMLKDPTFKDTLASMAKDPQFKNYMDVMQDMVKDPTKRRKIEAVSDAVKAQL